jgi:hypothetical protein
MILVSLFALYLIQGPVRFADTIPALSFARSFGLDKQQSLLESSVQVASADNVDEELFIKEIKGRIEPKIFETKLPIPKRKESKKPKIDISVKTKLWRYSGNDSDGVNPPTQAFIMIRNDFKIVTAGTVLYGIKVEELLMNGVRLTFDDGVTVQEKTIP